MGVGMPASCMAVRSPRLRLAIMLFWMGTAWAITCDMLALGFAIVG